MPSRRLVRTAVIASWTAMVVALAAVPLSAQGSPNDIGGFRALLLTPAGALPTVILVKAVRDSARRGWVAMEYVQYKERSAVSRYSNFGVSAQLKVWRSISVGGSYGYHTCNIGCDGLSMGSLDASGVLLHKSAKERDEADTEIGWQLSGGYGKAKQDVTAMSASLVLPMTLTLPQPYDGRLTLSLMPAVGYGRYVDNVGTIAGAGTGTFSSARLIIGAGVGYLFPRGLGLHATVHRIAVEESTTESALLISWRY